nr:MAG TPA: hypothetical protein [Caudoviricetes sp.]
MSFVNFKNAGDDTNFYSNGKSKYQRYDIIVSRKPRQAHIDNINLLYQIRIYQI